MGDGYSLLCKCSEAALQGYLCLLAYSHPLPTGKGKCGVSSHGGRSPQ